MKRFGLVLLMAVVAVAAMAESVWAGKCLDGCGGRCARRTRCGAVAPWGCCGIGICGECCEIGWTIAGPAIDSCNCGTPVAEEAVPEAAPTVVVPATPAEAPVPQPAVKVAPPAAKPTLAPPSAAPPAVQPRKAPAKPAEPKKADAPAKKVSWTGRGLRVWTDSTGSHQVTARFVATLDHGAVVRLLRPDGTYVRVPFAMLSADDRQYVLGQGAKLASAW